MGTIIHTNEYVDLCNRKLLTEYIKGFQPEIVIHLAAVTTVQEALENPVETYRTNALGTLTLLEILREIPSIKAILNVTTDKVYHIEGIDRGYVESDTLGGLENYAVSKACSELISTVYKKTFKLPLVTARAGNVIGGGDWKDSRIIPNYYAAYKNKTILDVNIDAVRPWQYVLDCLCGYLLLCENLYENTSYVGAWNFASNEYEARSVQWIVDEMNKYFNPKVEYRFIDARGYYETKNLKLCSNKAHTVLEWVPKYDMEETIRRTAQWYLAYDSGLDLYDTELEEYLR